MSGGTRPVRHDGESTGPDGVSQEGALAVAAEASCQRDPGLASAVRSLTDNAFSVVRRTARSGQEVVRDREADPDVSLAARIPSVAMLDGNARRG